MITNKLLAAQSFFCRNVEEFLESAGALKTTDGFVLNSAIGKLNIWVYENWIACRFDDPFAAHVFTRGISNRFSGKWNFIFHNDPITLNNGLVIADFVHSVENLLAYSPTPAEMRKANNLRNAARSCRTI